MPKRESYAVTMVGTFWPATKGTDLHLLPGTVSPRLDHLLHIEDDDDALDGKRVDQHPNVSVRFSAKFAGSPSAHGVTINEATGEITVAATLPATILRSFLVTATVKEGTTGKFTNRIRVYIHASLQTAWLTPNPLTVRKAAKGMRLTLLARFDDGVIGDITNWSPWTVPSSADRTFVHRLNDPNPILAWQLRADDSGENLSAGDVHQQTGVIRGDIVGEVASVAVTHPAGMSKARISIADEWSTGAELEHVAGPGFPAIGNADNPSILFLPEGFQDSEREDFRRIVRGIVHRLTNNPLTRPFDLLAGRLNYFMAWVGSPDAGVSVGQELDRLPSAVPLSANPIDAPSMEGNPATTWELRHLIHEVGLPSPAVDTPGSPLGTTTSGRLHDWQLLYGTHITPTKMSHLYQAWLDRSDRVLLNELDTAFHLQLGPRPRIDGKGLPQNLALNPRRLQSEDFDLFLDNLTQPGGAPVQNVWSHLGPDQALVVILGRTHRYGALNSNRPPGEDARLIGVSLGALFAHRIQASSTGPGFAIIADSIPRRVHPHTWATSAHELAHSWGLGDEYGGVRFVGESRLARMSSKANLQPHDDLLNAGQLETTNIKWRWPRIEAAGVTADGPVAVSGGFTVRLLPGHAKPRLNKDGIRVAGFQRDDIVQLRTRPLLPSAGTSARLRVIDVNITTDVLTLAFAEPAVPLLLFPAGSIVLKPAREKDPSPGVLGDTLELVSKIVLARIDATHNPLNAHPLVSEISTGTFDPPGRPPRDEPLKHPTAATNWPDGPDGKRQVPNPPRFSSWLVGVFENGDGNNLKAVHPTGACIMNQEFFTERRTRRTRVYQFCPVCRYAIVDRLDPTKHGEIDADYADRYPR